MNPNDPELRFEDALRRATDIVDRLDGDALELDEALALFEEGVQMLRAAEARLGRAEARLQVLAEDGVTLADLPEVP